MKKVLYSFFALAMAAMTFTSCEDVPAPYDIPGSDDDTETDTVVTVDPTGEGTLESPYNVAKALEIVNAGTQTEDKVYIKGIVKGTPEININYGNAEYNLADATNSDSSLKVFRGYYYNGGKFTSTDQIKEGDTLVIYGELTIYNNAPEVTTGSQIISINGKTSDSSSETIEAAGDGTSANPYNVPGAVAAGSATGAYVKGYIVGYIYGMSLSSGAVFGSDTCTVASNLLIAASADETNISNCMPVQLPYGDVRTALNLKDNKSNIKQEVTLYGNITKYFGVTGVKSVTYALLNGNEIGTNPDGGTSTGDYLNETFGSSQGNFTIEDISKDDALSYVWKWTSSYGMKASAYVSGTKYASQSRLVSPVMNLSKATSVTLTFDQAARYFSNASEELKLQVSTDGSTWTDVTIPTYPTGSDWTFVSTTVDLSAYAGKSTVYIGFLYTSTSSTAATWEIKNVVVK